MRFLLYLVSLFMTLIMFTIFASITGIISDPDSFGKAYITIIVLALIGTFLNIFASRVYGIWALSMEPLDINDEKNEEIEFHIKRLALSSGIRIPEIYVFESEKTNAILNGYNQNKTVLGISTKMLETFSAKEIAGAVAPLIAGYTNGSNKTKILLISLMNSFFLGIGKFIHDKIVNSGVNQNVATVIYYIFFVLSLISFNLPTFLILRFYSKYYTLKNDIKSTDITSYNEVISGLSRIGSKDCFIGKTEMYFSSMGKQCEKDNVLNPFSTIPNRINHILKSADVK